MRILGTCGLLLGLGSEIKVDFPSIASSPSLKASLEVIVCGVGAVKVEVDVEEVVAFV